jgi:hypothetical protein
MLSTGPHIQMAIVGSVNFTSSLNPSDAASEDSSGAAGGDRSSDSDSEDAHT